MLTLTHAHGYPCVSRKKRLLVSRFIRFFFPPPNPEKKADSRERFSRRRTVFHRDRQRTSGRGRSPLRSRAHHATEFRRAGDKEGMYRTTLCINLKFLRFAPERVCLQYNSHTGGLDPSLAQRGRKNILMETLNNEAHP